MDGDGEEYLVNGGVFETLESDAEVGLRSIGFRVAHSIV